MTLHYYSMIMSLVGELSEGRKSLSSPAHPSFSKHWLRNLPKQALWAFRVHKPNKQENPVARNSILKECWSMDAMSEISLRWHYNKRVVMTQPGMGTPGVVKRRELKRRGVSSRFPRPRPCFIPSECLTGNVWWMNEWKNEWTAMDLRHILLRWGWSWNPQGWGVRN